MITGGPGTGKTTLLKKLLDVLDKGHVKYRLAAPTEEVSDLGLAEMLADGVVLIEWADRAGSALPRPIAGYPAKAKSP